MIGQDVMLPGSPKINKPRKQKKTSNTAPAFETPQQLFLRATCVHSADVVCRKDTSSKYLSMREELQKEDNRRD